MLGGLTLSSNPAVRAKILERIVPSFAGAAIGVAA